MEKKSGKAGLFRELNRRTAVRRCLRLRERQKKAHRLVCLFVCVGLHFAFSLNNDAVAMVDFVLDNLCGPAGEGF